MGAWAEDAFGNDTAVDWASDFAENPSIERIDAAIEAVLTESDYIDSDIAAECLVACELVARLKGNWGARSAYSKSVDTWVETVGIRPESELVSHANSAIDRILGTKSELQELWDEDGVSAEWHSQMEDLQARVTN